LTKKNRGLESQAARLSAAEESIRWSAESHATSDAKAASHLAKMQEALGRAQAREEAIRKRLEASKAAAHAAAERVRGLETALSDAKRLSREEQGKTRASRAQLEVRLSSAQEALNGSRARAESLSVTLVSRRAEAQRSSAAIKSADVARVEVERALRRPVPRSSRRRITTW